MRVVIVESDPQGRSGVSRIIERSGLPTEENAHEIFAGPLSRLASLGQSEEFVELSPGAGAAMWRIYEFPPGMVFGMHHTDTVDFDVVVDGSMTLALDRDELLLTPGDAVLLRGDRHSWRAGDGGCRMLFALLGTVD